MKASATSLGLGQEKHPRENSDPGRGLKKERASRASVEKASMADAQARWVDVGLARKAGVAGASALRQKQGVSADGSRAKEAEVTGKLTVIGLFL